MEFENSDEFFTEYTRSDEYLDKPFEISNSVTIPVGAYRFQDVLASYRFGRQRVFSGNLEFQHGSFYGGELFVVYNEQRDTLTPRYPELENRSFVVKINRLFRF